MRLGRIPWINCYPVYGAIDRGLVPVARRAGDAARPPTSTTCWRRASWT